MLTCGFNRNKGKLLFGVSRFQTQPANLLVRVQIGEEVDHPFAHTNGRFPRLTTENPFTLILRLEYCNMQLQHTGNTNTGAPPRCAVAVTQGGIHPHRCCHTLTHYKSSCRICSPLRAVRARNSTESERILFYHPPAHHTHHLSPTRSSVAVWQQ